MLMDESTSDGTDPGKMTVYLSKKSMILPPNDSQVVIGGGGGVREKKKKKKDLLMGEKNLSSTDCILHLTGCEG